VKDCKSDLGLDAVESTGRCSVPKENFRRNPGSDSSAAEAIPHRKKPLCDMCTSVPSMRRPQPEYGVTLNAMALPDAQDSLPGSHDRDVSFQRLAEVLSPFFVTRQIFAGAGKVLQTPRGFHYCLSQRAPHICQEISGATTSTRSIINTRDEPHAEAERYRRLHIIVGDSNMSEVATYLKLGTTAMVLDMMKMDSSIEIILCNPPCRRYATSPTTRR